VSAAAALTSNQAAMAKGFVGSCDSGRTDVERIRQFSTVGSGSPGPVRPRWRPRSMEMAIEAAVVPAIHVCTGT
jgi:hypothetical protein